LNFYIKNQVEREIQTRAKFFLNWFTQN